jgi:hypothetical protein
MRASTLRTDAPDMQHMRWELILDIICWTYLQGHTNSRVVVFTESARLLLFSKVIRVMKKALILRRETSVFFFFLEIFEQWTLIHFATM